MNGPFLRTEVQEGLIAFAFFHLNLAFSSIEEERRDAVIASCYHPLLDLCENRGPLGVEMSGYTRLRRAFLSSPSARQEKLSQPGISPGDKPHLLASFPLARVSAP
jgi:hypothetical protein